MPSVIAPAPAGQPSPGREFARNLLSGLRSIFSGEDVSRRTAVTAIASVPLAAAAIQAEAADQPTQAEVELPQATPPATDYPIPEPSNDVFMYLSPRGEVLSEKPTAFDARHYHRLDAEPGRVKRERFEPLVRSDRFVVVSFEWDVADVWTLGGPMPSGVFLDKVCGAREALRDSFAPPRSLIDIPPGFGGMHEGDDQGEVTLEEGLQIVAEQNAVSLEDGPAIGMEWFCLVELGVRRRRRLLCVDVCANGIGSLDTAGGDPIRLYRPTAEELARFPIDPELLAGNWSEGGEA